MGFNKVGFILLVIVYGGMIMGGDMKIVEGKICPQICYEAAYMTCPSTGDEHLSPACSCCIASTGCTLYNSDGTPICTAS
ncbi:PREDICTED: proteinase inhibitor PSI-1.2-like [Lupinus angustifolius]|uniref:proteinase inhibitor PSI-1.2-like n=1 Tax=Lupinus angustifolius TaxID=3871 RepID=UPI00092E2308|nr:PREDICTED: proteinase inhibitor PSI-1.2-like [Lupinus angustifolius]